MNSSISRLIELAKCARMTDKDREEQRRSFVYGNTAFENRDITRALVDSKAEAMPRENTPRAHKDHT